MEMSCCEALVPAIFVPCMLTSAPTAFCDSGDSCGTMVFVVAAAEAVAAGRDAPPALPANGFGLLDVSRDLIITCTGIVVERFAVPPTASSEPESGDFSRDVSSTCISLASSWTTVVGVRAAVFVALDSSIVASVTFADVEAPAALSLSVSSTSCSSELSGETDSSSKIFVGSRTSWVTFSDDSFE